MGYQDIRLPGAVPCSSHPCTLVRHTCGCRKIAGFNGQFPLEPHNRWIAEKMAQQNANLRRRKGRQAARAQGNTSPGDATIDVSPWLGCAQQCTPPLGCCTKTSCSPTSRDSCWQNGGVWVCTTLPSVRTRILTMRITGLRQSRAG